MEKKFKIGLGMGILGLLLVLVGCTTEQPVADPISEDYEDAGIDAIEGTETADFTVEIVNSQFTPEMIEIEVGDSITWVNQDEITHIVTVLGVEREIMAGEAITYLFSEPGIYDLQSTVYPEMMGTVIVVEANAEMETSNTDDVNDAEDSASSTTDVDSSINEDNTAGSGGY